MRLSLAYSPCPNDTYIFYALAHEKIPVKHVELDIFLHDVEYLNQAAKTNRFDITKLSFAALGHLLDQYVVLHAGAALGRGCGPLIVGPKGMVLSDLKGKKIAVPGLWTTANLLLSLYMKEPLDVVPMSFDQIMPSIQAKIADCGVIIHEGRFTYENYGLISLLDLGQWWEKTTALPIPLGGIAIRRTIPPNIARIVQDAIRNSIVYVRQHPHEADEYIRSHAQELSYDVIQQHIGLYVNEFSMDLGETGMAAIRALFSMANAQGIMGCVTQQIFLSTNT